MVYIFELLDQTFMFTNNETQSVNTVSLRIHLPHNIYFCDHYQSIQKTKVGRNLHTAIRYTFYFFQMTIRFFNKFSVDINTRIFSGTFKTVLVQNILLNDRSAFSFLMHVNSNEFLWASEVRLKPALANIFSCAYVAKCTFV